MKKKIISILALCTFVFSSFTLNVQAQNKERVTFGIDLTDVQEEDMLKEFGVSADKVSIDRVTNDDIVKQLGLDPNDKSNYQGGCYSSSYVKLTNDNGVIVTANNLTEVTGLMLSNALLTSGVINAEVKASSPFSVTGTSALSGILKGFEALQGEELSLKNKKTAQKEIETTSTLADEIGFDEAATVINDVKTEIIKESPKTEKEISSIVNDVTSDYKIELSEEQKTSITNLMVDINNLDIDYGKVKDTLSNLSDQLSNALEETGTKLSDSGFFQKIIDSIGDFFRSIGDFFKSLFSNDSETPDTTPESNEGLDTPTDATPESENIEDVTNDTEVPLDTETPTESPVDNSTPDSNADSNSDDNNTENEAPVSDSTSNDAFNESAPEVEVIN